MFSLGQRSGVRQARSLASQVNDASHFLGCDQHTTTVATQRRTVLRVAPETLTGVSDRPTTAKAGKPKLRRWWVRRLARVWRTCRPCKKQHEANHEPIAQASLRLLARQR
jgi:hypothetical protein